MWSPRQVTHPLCEIFTSPGIDARENLGHQLLVLYCIFPNLFAIDHTIVGPLTPIHYDKGVGTDRYIKIRNTKNKSK